MTGGGGWVRGGQRGSGGEDSELVERTEVAIRVSERSLGNIGSGVRRLGRGHAGGGCKT